MAQPRTNGRASFMSSMASGANASAFASRAAETDYDTDTDAYRYGAMTDEEDYNLVRAKRSVSASAANFREIEDQEEDQSAITDLADLHGTPYATFMLQRSASAENTLVREFLGQQRSRTRGAARRRRLRSEIIRRKRVSMSMMACAKGASTLGTLKRHSHLPAQRTVSAPAETSDPPASDSSSEDEDEDDEKSKKREKRGFYSSLDRRRKLLLVVLGVSDMCAYVCLSMMAPFFPLEAEKKGLSNTMSGWIFGVFALVEVVFCPIFAHFVERIGVRFTYIAGMFSSACCNILFGFLDETPSDADGGTTFAVLCFVVRACQALGMAAYLTAAFTILSIEYRKHVSKAFAFNETFVAVGFILGPTIGGALYSVGGFKLPFIALGVVLLILSVINYMLLPYSADDKDEESDSFSMREFLSHPLIIVIFLAVATSGIGISVLDPTLEPHLREFNFDPTLVGFIFLIPSAVYTFATPLVGWLCSKLSAYWMITIGFIGLSLTLLLLAASPLLGFPVGFNELYVNIIALVAIGVTFAFAMIPTFEMMLNVCIVKGIKNSVALYSAVGGLWSSAYALGDFLGPVLGGTLLDTLKFQWGITVVATIPMLLVVILLIVGFATKFRIAKLEAEVSRIEAEQGEEEEDDDEDDVKRPATKLTTERTPLIETRQSIKV